MGTESARGLGAKGRVEGLNHFETILNSESETVTKHLRAGDRTVALEVILRNEAAVLEQLDALVTPRCLYCGPRGGDYVLETSLLKGQTLRDLMKEAPLSLGRVLEIGEKLALALKVVHDRGFLHGDLKPEHVLLDEQGLYLCDFGFACRLGAEAGTGCTPLYAAPEQLGLVRADLGAEVDLYALGVILLELMLGENPWQGSTELSDRLSVDWSYEQVPEDMALVLRRLLHPDPHRRYSSAFGVAADLGVLRRGESLPSIGRHDQRRRPNLSAFVGRKRELRILKDWMQQDRWSSLAISAVSGMGKSRLLEEFAEHCRRVGAIPLYVRGRLSAQSIGYPLCKELAGLIKAHFLSDAADTERLARELGYWSPVLARAFAPLRDLTETRYDLSPLTAAVVDAWSALMAQLGKRHNFVILIDDLQWADPLTLDWLCRKDNCGARVVVAYRAEEVERLDEVVPFFDSVVAVEPLTDEESQDLVRSMTGEVSQELLKPLVDRAAGEPFVLQSLVWGAYEAGASSSGDGGWNWTSNSLEPTMEAGRLLSQRLKSLGHDAHRLLRGAAVLGKEFQLDHASHLLSLPPEIEEQAWKISEERHLVWVEGKRAGFTHDKIREALLREPIEDDDAALHNLAADWLLIHEPESHDRLALHLAAAKREKEALDQARLGEAEAQARLDFATAESMQRLLHSLAASVCGKDEQARICLELGRTLALRSGFAEAVEVYREGLALVRDREDEFDLMVELAFALVKSYRLEEARPLVHAGFQRLGLDFPRSSVGRYLRAGILWKKFLGRLEKMDGITPWISNRQAEAAGKLFRLTTEMGSVTADISMFLMATMHGCLFSLTSPVPPLAICLSHAGILAVSLGSLGHAKTLFDRAKNLAGTSQFQSEVWGQSTFLDVAEGRLGEAAHTVAHSADLASRCGDMWNKETCFGFLGQLHQHLGQFEQASEVAKQIQNSKIADETCRLTAARILCLVGHGVTLVVGHEWYDTTRPNRFVCLAQQALGVRELHRSSFDNAIRHLSIASDAFEPGLFFFGAPSASWLATAYRVRAEGRTAEDSAAAQGDFKKAQRAAHKALKDTKKWIVCQPHALREYALASAHAGRFHLARKAFEESWTLSEQMGMQFESAWTLYERGRLARVAGWTDWLDDQAEGLARVQRLGGWLPGVDLSSLRSGRQLAGIDRFDRVLEAGRRLVALDRDQQVLETLREEARLLLRCDRVRILHSDHDLEGLSETLYRRCLVEQRAVTEAIIEEPTQSLLLHEARSTLMVPLRLSQERVGVLVAWQRSLGGFFLEEELRLADYLRALAEASLENAKMLRQREETFLSLKASEERFRDFFRYAGVGTALLSNDGTTVEENDYLQTLLSCSTVGKRPWEYCHSEDREILKAGFQGLAESRERCDLELRLHRAGGEVAWAQCCLVRLPVPHGEQRRYLFTVADTTHKRIAEMMNFLEGERRSLSAEVHDGLSQNMTALHFLLSGFGDEDPRLVKAKELSARLIDDASSLISSLRNPLAEGVDLLQALKDLVFHFSLDHSAEVQVTWPEQLPEVSDLSAMVLYRVLQEGLANIRKHSQARMARVEFSDIDDHLQITLTDDGVGFDADAWLDRRGVRKHFGLLSMRDRVEMVGGRFSLDSEPGRGVALVVGVRKLGL